MATTKLATPVFTKVKEIEKGTSGYNVKVQVVKVEREVAANPIAGKKLTIVKAVVGDDTAVANAFFKLENPEMIQQGKVYAIRNGRRNIVKGHISLEVDAFGRITEEKDDVKATGTHDISLQEIKRREAPEGGERRRPKRREDDEEYRREPRKEGRRDREDRDEKRERRGDREDRRGDREERRERRQNRDRDYDRGDREGRREGGERRDRDDRRDRAERGPKREGGDRRRDTNDDQPVTYIKIKEIGPGDENISFVAKVIKLKERTETRAGEERTFLDCVLGDSTGIVNGSFFANTRVKEGNVYSFKRVNAKVIKEHIQIQKGRTGFIDDNESTIKEINEKNNISDKSYELEE